MLLEHSTKEVYMEKIKALVAQHPIAATAIISFLAGAWIF